MQQANCRLPCCSRVCMNLTMKAVLPPDASCEANPKPQTLNPMLRRLGWAHFPVKPLQNQRPLPYAGRCNPSSQRNPTPEGMSSSQNRRTPKYTLIYKNPFYRGPKKVPLILGNPQIYFKSSPKGPTARATRSATHLVPAHLKASALKPQSFKL